MGGARGRCDDLAVADDDAAVREALRALDAAFEQGDLEAILDLCTGDVVFIGSGEGEEAVGRDGVARMLKRIAPKAEATEFDLAWESVGVEVLGNVALVVAWGSASLVNERRTATTRYRLTGMLVREEGRWLWRVHHGSEPAAW